MIDIFELKKMSQEDAKRITQRAQEDIDTVREQVKEIIAIVKKDGDRALVAYTKKWDEPNFDQSRLKVTEEEISTAYSETPKNITETIKEQIFLAKKFHRLQKEHILDWQKELENGIVVGEKWTPISNVGLYVPGGKNPFPTVQQILAVAATTAGSQRIVSCISPRGKNYEVLIAANECGIKEIYRISGPQAIAAMAYGTETIRPVDIIAGPESPHVTCAKILCQEKIAIDMPAGPSEAIILADDWLPTGTSIDIKAKYCAADILARAEHGPDSAGVLVTNSARLAQLTKAEIEKQFAGLSRKEYISTALKKYSAIIVTANMDEAITFTNSYAPEHLEILTEDPDLTLKSIEHAGSVFLGFFNPVATGDYATGVNHVLPSSGWARRTSPVGVWTFMKRVQYSRLSEAGLRRLCPIVQAIATVEGP